MKKLILFGAGHAFVLKTINAINALERSWNLLGFIDDDPEKIGKDLFGYPILGDRSLLGDLATDSDTYFFNNVMGHWSRRRQISEMLEERGCQIASLIDPQITSLDLRPGKGVFIGAFTALGTSVEVGDYSVIMESVGVGDDVKFGTNVFVSFGAYIGSRAVIGDHTFMGPRSIVLMDHSVGERAVVAANATVNRDVDSDARMFGTPARAK